MLPLLPHALALAAAVALQFRGTSPAGLFSAVALSYLAAAGLWTLAEASINPSIPMTLGAASDIYHDTYYVISHNRLYLETGVVWAALAGVIWVQQRIGAMVAPRLTRVAFWGLATGQILASALPQLIIHLTGPRHVDFPGLFGAVNLLATWLSAIAALSFFALTGLLTWSLWQRFRPAG